MFSIAAYLDTVLRAYVRETGDLDVADALLPELCGQAVVQYNRFWHRYAVRLGRTAEPQPYTAFSLAQDLRRRYASRYGTPLSVNGDRRYSIGRLNEIAGTLNDEQLRGSVDA